MVSVGRKIWYCLFLNVAVTSLVTMMAFIFKDGEGKFWRIGPSPDLIVVSVVINTPNKYALVILLLAVIGVSEVIIYEIGSPVLEFNIYNPDKKVITDFTRNELQFLGNTMFFMNSIRIVFIMVVSVTQVDLALISVIIKGLASIWSIRKLLEDKKCKGESYEQLIN